MANAFQAVLVHPQTGGMTNRSGKYPIIVSSPQSGFHQAASGSKNAYQNSTSSGKSGRRPIMCLSFPGLLRSSRLIVARYSAGAAHRKYSGPRQYREDTLTAATVRPRGTAIRDYEHHRCRTSELSLISRRASGRHTDQTGAKANVLTCKNPLRIGHVWRPDSLSRSRKASSCE